MGAVFVAPDDGAEAPAITVGRAVSDLRRQGLVRRRAGSGTFVREAADRVASGGLSLGVLIPDLGRTEIFEPICQGMAKALRQRTVRRRGRHRLRTGPGSFVSAISPEKSPASFSRRWTWRRRPPAGRRIARIAASWRRWNKRESPSCCSTATFCRIRRGARRTWSASTTGAPAFLPRNI